MCTATSAVLKAMVRRVTVVIKLIDATECRLPDRKPPQTPRREACQSSGILAKAQPGTQITYLFRAPYYYFNKEVLRKVRCFGGEGADRPRKLSTQIWSHTRLADPAFLQAHYVLEL